MPLFDSYDALNPLIDAVFSPCYHPASAMLAERKRDACPEKEEETEEEGETDTRTKTRAVRSPD